MEEIRSPVGRPDFKSGKDRQTILGGFDSHSLPPFSLAEAVFCLTDDSSPNCPDSGKMCGCLKYLIPRHWPG